MAIESKLTAKQQRFVDEYLIDLNATQAAIRAGYSEKTANEQGARLLANVSVGQFIKQRMDDRSQRTEITQDMVLKHWWDIATADARKLIEYRREACRHCYGKNHKYQYIDEAEFIIEYNRAVELAEAEPDGNHPIPDNEGGFGYSPMVTPHAHCPKCFGKGREAVYPHDTRNLDEQSAKLYAGVKVSKEGLTVLMRDQDGAMENVAKHLGMFIDRKEVGKPGDFENLSDDELERRTEAALAAIEAGAAIRTAKTPPGKTAKAKS
jgi:phage terminase small subunit